MHIGVNVELSERIQKDLLRPRKAKKKTFPEKTRSEISPDLPAYFSGPTNVFFGSRKVDARLRFRLLSVRKNPNQAQTPTEQHHCCDNPGTQ